jgi:hypothetical protein
MGFTNWTGLAFMSAGFAGVTAFWNQIKGFFDRISSLVVITVDLQNNAGDMFMQYAWKNFKRSAAAQRRFTAYTVFVRPRNKYGMVAFEMSGKSLTFWDGWKPLFISASTDKDGEFTGSVKLTYLRGLFDTDALLVAAAEQVNRDHHTKSENSSRYSVKKIFGKRKDDESYGYGRPVSDGEKTIGVSSEMPVGFKRDDIGAYTSKTPFYGLSYPKHIKHFENEIRSWKDSEQWYKDHGIKWRFGAGLFGPPGTGKTSIVRALAQDLDMPIHIYDLSTLSNEELTKAWSKSLNATPCVVLFEDLDRVFVKDKNVRGNEKHASLTMDALLNCIAGVESADGILIFVTANDPSKLDEALGVPDVKGESTRPGRLDRIVIFGPLEEEGRRDIAARILSDIPEVIEETVKAGEGEVGAQFENRCVKIALEHRWGKPHVMTSQSGSVTSSLGITKKGLHLAGEGDRK